MPTVRTLLASLTQILFQNNVKLYKMRAGPMPNPAVFEKVPLQQDTTMAATSCGHVIAFYNQVFVAAAKPTLMGVLWGQLPLVDPAQASTVQLPWLVRSGSHH